VSVDPLASLRVRPIGVACGGREWVIPALPAADWFEAVLAGGSLPIVPGMLDPGDEEEFLDLMLAGTITEAQALRANRDALGVASGWKWWEAERLIVSIAHDWKVVGGLLLQSGIDFQASPIGAVLATTYSLAVQNLSKEDRFRLDAQLTRAPVEAMAGADWFEQGGFAESFRALVSSASTGG
jgi:hypothetical protein